jgi:hypothetical protein
LNGVTKASDHTVNAISNSHFHITLLFICRIPVKKLNQTSCGISTADNPVEAAKAILILV